MALKLRSQRELMADANRASCLRRLPGIYATVCGLKAHNLQKFKGLYAINEDQRNCQLSQRI